MQNLTKENYESIIANGKVLIDFYTDWCGYCRILEPVIKELSQKYSGSVTVVKVDADLEKEIADHYGITGYPTVVVLDNGIEIARKTGANPISVYEDMLV